MKYLYRAEIDENGNVSTIEEQEFENKISEEEFNEMTECDLDNFLSGIRESPNVEDEYLAMAANMIYVTFFLEYDDGFWNPIYEKETDFKEWAAEECFYPKFKDDDKDAFDILYDKVNDINENLESMKTYVSLDSTKSALIQTDDFDKSLNQLINLIYSFANSNLISEDEFVDLLGHVQEVRNAIQNKRRILKREITKKEREI